MTMHGSRFFGGRSLESYKRTHHSFISKLNLSFLYAHTKYKQNLNSDTGYSFGVLVWFRC